MATITAANAVFQLGVPGVFNTPQQLQGFATDDAFTNGAQELAEIIMGVDGILSAGWVPAPFEQTIHLQADSPSIITFETWQAAERAIQEKLPAFALVKLSSVQRQYSMPVGYLKTQAPMPSARKVLQPRDFVIVWGVAAPSPG